MRSNLMAVIAALGLLSGSVPAVGQDHPIAARKLDLAVTPNARKLVFVSTDPSFLFPAIGSPNDPASGPDGLTVSLLSPTEGIYVLTVPSGVGQVGWSSRAGTMPVYRYKNRLAPNGPSMVRMAIIKSGSRVKIVARATGLSLGASQGTVAVVVSTGTLRNCALFGPATVKIDQSGRFRAIDAPAPDVVDCDSNSLIPGALCNPSGFPTCGGVCPAGGTCTPETRSPTCHCVLPTQPCGDTAEACNGICPGGEECAPLGTGFPPYFGHGCGCIPAGATPCGQPGLPTCGGTCPSGSECGGYLPFDFPSAACTCVPPDPCAGAALGTCPGGLLCADLSPSGSSRACVPQLCAGTYPTCGGSCGDGGECRPATFDLGSSPFLTCVCSPHGPCDAGCALGNECPAGEVCRHGVGSCGCGAP